MQLKAYDPWVFEKFFRHLKCFCIAWMVGGEAVKVRDFIQDFEVPGIDAFGHALLVGIIGVGDCADVSLSEIVRALSVIEVMEHIPSIVFLKEVPDGFKESVREKVNMKVDDLVGKFNHMSGIHKP